MKMQSTVEITSQRIHWLDYARVAAIISISTNHAVNRSFGIYSGTYEEFIAMPMWLTVIKAALYLFSRIGVPFFLMITGALLLGRDYTQKNTLNKFYKNNWLSLIITTEIWLAIMYIGTQLHLFLIYRTLSKSTIVEFILTMLFLKPSQMGSMWYMPMIICVYTIIPIISIAIEKIDDARVFMIPVLIGIVYTMVIPSANQFLKTVGVNISLESQLGFENLFSVYLAYILAGYYIAKKEILKKLSTIGIITAAAIIGSGMICCQVWFYASPVTDYRIAYDNISVLVVSILLFELLRRKKEVLEESRCNAGVEYISRISFGIYFVHICVMEELESLLNRFEAIYPLLKCFLLEVGAVGIAIVLIWFLSKNRILRRYLFVIKE